MTYNRMKEQPEHIKLICENLKKAHNIKVINITVALDANNKVVHSHMEHPQPITRPTLMDILEGLREQVIKDYEVLEKSASTIENAESILSILKKSEPAHDRKTKHRE